MSMANTANADKEIQIAGMGHVYVGDVDTAAPDLWAYEFGDGTTLEAQGWKWIGDTSSENLIEFETDGGDASTKDTWDRKNARSTRASKTTNVTINSVSFSDDTIQTAFPGSTYVEETDGYDLVLSGSTDRAILIVIVEGQLVSGILLRKVNLSGDMPTLDKENFTEVKMKGVLLTPPSGKTSVHYLRAREVTGKATAAPTITEIKPTNAKVGDTVTVTGTNFDGVRRVLVGTTAASFTKRSATVLTVKVPTVSTGQQTISVVNGKGKADSATKLTVA
jgi:hypothetical protein